MLSAWHKKVWRHAGGQRPMNIFVHYPVDKKDVHAIFQFEDS